MAPGSEGERETDPLTANCVLCLPSSLGTSGCVCVWGGGSIALQVSVQEVEKEFKDSRPL